MISSAIGALFMWGRWISRLMLQGKGQLYSRVARYFKGSPADRESDSTVGNAHLLTSHPVGCCLC